MYRAFLKVAAGVLGFGLAAYAAWWLYDFGKLSGVVELESLRAGHAAMQQSNETLSSDNKSLLARVAILERSAGIDLQATEDIRNDLERLED